ncbi:MAG: acyl-CoA dehydrogenase family protein [Devosiaceae bacterium]|nr:acyl-CoA dehydrogenase family protein [Devosiaceae bacterium]
MKNSNNNLSLPKGEESLNQSPFFLGHNAFTNDPVLLRLCKDLPTDVLNSLEELGKWTGSAEANELARLANTEIPKLKTHDSKGNRLDVVQFHPAWHALMEKSVSYGLHCSVWDKDEKEKGQRNFVRAVRYILMAATDCGHLCPMTMTNASVGALKAAPDLLAQWLPKILSRQYDGSQKSAAEKPGVQIGMGMTEKQGGTDLRANISKAKEDGNRGWRINGHKWFMSAPMGDAFLILAHDVDSTATEESKEKPLGQPSCFLVPRLLPDGSKNGLNFVRLKDKLGNRSNASSEVEFNNSLAMIVGKPGKGLRVILEMVTLTRLDCATASAGLMRAALAEAVFHCRHREVFGKKLIDQPIMSRVLADMSLDVAGAVALSLRLSRSFDLASSNEAEAAYARLMTPAIKYWVCKSAPVLIGEAMECLGGNGYVEEGNLARQYREAPVNSIWEGSGNVMCLDVLRVLKKTPQILETVLDMLADDLGESGGKIIAQLRRDAVETVKDEGLARIFVEKLALSAAAAELSHSIDTGLADAFMTTRLEGRWRATYGMLPSGFDAKEIVEFICPEN